MVGDREEIWKLALVFAEHRAGCYPRGGEKWRMYGGKSNVIMMVTLLQGVAVFRGNLVGT